MAEIVWAEPALADLDAIADYIALENPVAAAELVRRIFTQIQQLMEHPQSGSKPLELKRSRYRQIVESPGRVFYRFDGQKVFVLYESDGRFGNEKKADLSKSVMVIDNKTILFKETDGYLYLDEKGVPKRKTDKELEAERGPVESAEGFPSNSVAGEEDRVAGLGVV